MCNLYSLTKGQAAILAFTWATQDRAGNLPSVPAIFSDAPALVVTTVDGERTLQLARWGLMQIVGAQSCPVSSDADYKP